MKYYLIVSDQDFLPNEQLMKSLREYGEVEIIIHKGPFESIAPQLDNDDEKIICIEPDVVDWDLDVEPILRLKKVKAVITQSTSYDWVKPNVLSGYGIAVINTPGFSTESVAEYIIAMAINCARCLPLHLKNNWRVDWSAKPYLLKGKTMGIIGLGKIGLATAKLATGIGMDILYWSRQYRDQNYTYADLETVFKQSDVLVVTIAENSETHTLLHGKDKIDLMKPTASIIGINRVKQLLDEEYIFEKVKKGELHGYAFEGDSAKPLESYEGNVMAYPPMAWFTNESNEKLLEIWVQNMIDCAQNNFPNKVA